MQEFGKDMENKKVEYKLVNIVVIFITAVLFINNYKNFEEIFADVDIKKIGVIVTTVLLVHLIKATRLYLTLYGSELTFAEYMKVYCKATPVSVVLPFKLGDFFRMYCYGKTLNNVLKGIVTILLDRFMDTIALVTMIFLIWFFNGGKIANIVYMLLLFLAFVLLIYYVFPGVYKFWKKYILRAKATKHKLTILRYMERLHDIYMEIMNVSMGRGIILYFMSLLAWGIEIGSLALLNGIEANGKLEYIISSYLMAAIGSGKSIELLHFVFVSIVITLAAYIIIKFMELTFGKRE